MLNGYIDPTILHRCATTHPTAIHTSHVTGKYVSETNIPTNIGIYAKFLIRFMWKMDTHISITL